MTVLGWSELYLYAVTCTVAKVSGTAMVVARPEELAVRTAEQCSAGSRT